MATLNDWKKSLSAGVSVRTLLGLDDKYLPTEKTKKRKLPEDSDKLPTNFQKDNDLKPSHEGSASEITEFHKFEASLEVKGFLKGPQHFQWTSFPSSILVEQSIVKSEINLQPPIPSIPLKEVLGPCFITVLPSPPKRRDDSSSE